jgi:hypothetical protein
MRTPKLVFQSAMRLWLNGAPGNLHELEWFLQRLTLGTPGIVGLGVSARQIDSAPGSKLPGFDGNFARSLAWISVRGSTAK